MIGQLFYSIIGYSDELVTIHEGKICTAMRRNLKNLENQMIITVCFSK